MEECSFSNCTKSNTPPWVFFMLLKLYKWYQIAQRTAYEISQFIFIGNKSFVFYMVRTLTVLLIFFDVIFYQV